VSRRQVFCPVKGTRTMPRPVPPLDDVFTMREIARAAKVPVRDVEALVTSGRIGTVDGRYVSPLEAVRAIRLLQATSSVAPNAAAGYFPGPRSLFEAPIHGRRNTSIPLVASGALHAGLVLAIALVTSLGVRGAARAVPPQEVRMVFLSRPGPGGGGGGGGLRQPAPPPKAKLQGKSALKSPVPVDRAVRAKRPDPPRPAPPPPPPVEAAPKPVEPPPPVAKLDPVPPVVAPVVSAPADERDKPGVLNESTAQGQSRGPGSGTGSGTGTGSGIGEGDGSGIGPGTGGGIGGGPYGPGSGVSAPTVLHEVKPQYSEEARQRHLEGDVLLEIVVRADGSVGNVRLVQGLGSGLDQRAIEAVRRWRFNPGRRHGSPVDVLVEVAVEFRLR
jgi:periplasmic protein TonB